ncbi:Hypothetical transmembrane protein [Tenacibaculum jejuense]|uniref:Hypothetical transmembrane protein n=1 Tax=Tenacibaculum jejuense TaxID=584609 RepID=A0A238UCW1_9FLAO|nr:Hypothetical transmembrane protein [Tenacibaculum jejuense]
MFFFHRISPERLWYKLFFIPITLYIRTFNVDKDITHISYTGTGDPHFWCGSPALFKKALVLTVFNILVLFRIFVTDE